MKAIVLGAGGFIGYHLVKRLKNDGYFVRAIDLKYPQFADTWSDEFIIADLRDPGLVKTLLEPGYDECYQLAADMGGAGFVFTGENDADIIHNNLLINLNVAHYATTNLIKKLFFSSSACVYPKHNQEDPKKPICKESSVYPANPDSEYGWEKLISERLYRDYEKNYGLNIRIARYHNIYGPYGTFEGGREKVIASLCRKITETEFNKQDHIKIWGTGEQTRSFLYIDDCINMTRALMKSNFDFPVNIGSEEMVTINDLARMLIHISKKKLSIKHIVDNVPIGVMGRNSDNKMFREMVDKIPVTSLKYGLKDTYRWIHNEITQRRYIYERNPETGDIQRRPVT